MRRAAIVVSSLGALDLALRMMARSGLAEFVGLTSGPSPLVVLLATLAIAAVGAGAAVRARRSATVLLFVAAFACGLYAQARLGARLQSDGFFYFAYVRSLVFDRDVNFFNDYRLLGLDDPQHQFLLQPTATGHAQTAWSIGPGLLWSPFFAAGHAVAVRLAREGRQVDTIGTSYPYRQAAVVAGLFYGLLGLWFTFRFVRIYSPPGEAGAAVVLTAAGSFILWYLVREPTMAHAPSMAAVALFAWTWADGRGRRGYGGWAALGLIGGLMMAVRWQNAVFFLLPGVELLRMLRSGDRRALWFGAALGAAALLAFSPQMIAWRAIYGGWLVKPPAGPEMRWLSPELADVLWSSRNGLFAWSPIFIPAIVGLAALRRRDPVAAWGSLALFAVMTWVNGSVEDWWGGAGFGMRRFDGLVPFAALGVAVTIAMVSRAMARRPAWVVGTGLTLLVLWNVSLMAVAQSGAYRIGQPISFGEVGARQAAIVHRWFGHPFSYPANLAYAAANGVAPWRYDLLRPYRFLGDPRRPYGRVDVGDRDEWMLGDGWHGAERDGATSFRWASSAASLLVPLDHPAPLVVQVRLHAFGYPGAPPQTLTLAINGVPLAPVAVGPGWETVEIATGPETWRSGVNRVALQFAWSARPADVGLGGDARRLSAAVDYVRVAVR